MNGESNEMDNRVYSLFWDRIMQTCDVGIEDASVLTPEEFAMSRRNGLGASDASVFLGLQTKWRTTEDLITNKCRTEYTEEEAEIGRKIVVRTGNVMEPFTLELFSEATGIPVIKPKESFKLKELPFLTINYDGIGNENEEILPVEAKYVSFYGDRYYAWERGATYSDKEQTDMPLTFNVHALTQNSIVERCEEAAKMYGPPAYYYAQVQQQLIALPNAPYAYLAAYRSKASSLMYFCIPHDIWLQNKIKTEGYRVWQRIERQRK